jgi:putative transposase
MTLRGARDEDAAPHSSSLRLWRQDIAACTYFVRSRTASHARFLARDEAAALVVQALRFAEQSGWVTVFSYAIMPDHWHALWKLGPTRSLASVMQSLKRQTARQLNALSERSGPVWQSGYHEALIRSQQEFGDCLSYMAMNPVRGGLAARPGEHPWTSVSGLREP